MNSKKQRKRERNKTKRPYDSRRPTTETPIMTIERRRAMSYARHNDMQSRQDKEHEWMMRATTKTRALLYGTTNDSSEKVMTVRQPSAAAKSDKST